MGRKAFSVVMLTVRRDVSEPTGFTPSVYCCIVNAIGTCEARCAQPTLIFRICGEVGLERHRLGRLDEDILGLSRKDGHEGATDSHA